MFARHSPRRGWLAGIALVALLIGAGALALSTQNNDTEPASMSVLSDSQLTTRAREIASSMGVPMSAVTAEETLRLNPCAG